LPVDLAIINPTLPQPLPMKGGEIINSSPFIRGGKEGFGFEHFL